MKHQELFDRLNTMVCGCEHRSLELARLVLAVGIEVVDRCCGDHTLHQHIVERLSAWLLAAASFAAASEPGDPGHQLLRDRMLAEHAALYHALREENNRYYAHVLYREHCEACHPGEDCGRDCEENYYGPQGE